jgi:hypothetical protein
MLFSDMLMVADRLYLEIRGPEKTLRVYERSGYLFSLKPDKKTIMTYSQNKNRRIRDLSMYVYEYKPGDSGREYTRRKVKWDVYQPLPCKILARTSREYIYQD